MRDIKAWQDFKKKLEEKPMEDLTIQQKCEKIKEFFGFDDNTIMYFQYYRYNVALIDKLYYRAVNGEK